MSVETHYNNQRIIVINKADQDFKIISIFVHQTIKDVFSSKP